MNSFIVCVLAMAAMASARPDLYTDRYDNIDVKEVVENRRLLVPYVHCILEKGKCSPEAKELKSHIKEALENYCGNCNEVQKTKTRQVIGHLINHEAEYWKELTDKYDPQRKYTNKYEKDLKVLKA